MLVFNWGREHKRITRVEKLRRTTGGLKKNQFVCKPLIFTSKQWK